MKSRIIWCGAQLQIPVRVSAIDYDSLMRVGKWLATHPNRTGKQYAYRQRREGGKQIMIWMHKVVCTRAYGEAPSPLHTMVDHLDGDSLDNRRHMLRWATPSMNSANRFGWHYKQPELPF